jgi:hypothetical protein
VTTGQARVHLHRGRNRDIASIALLARIDRGKMHSNKTESLMKYINRFIDALLLSFVEGTSH